ncbi:formate transporter [Bifidobacterium eulemuris]|nr:formate transporter [Bifidobacterium eulemuris]
MPNDYATTLGDTPSPPSNGTPFAAPQPMDPLFPGRTFVSTVLDALDSKKTMTGKMAGKYMQRAIMAGLFVGIFFTTYFAIVAAFRVEGAPAGFPILGKVLASLTFGWALVLIFYTNSELLTSNMMIVSIGAYHHRINWAHSLRILALCLTGNLIGGLVIAILLRFSTIIDGAVFDQMVAAVQLKTGYLHDGAFGVADLFVRAILCNFCINIGMLMVYNGKLTNDFTKCVIMVVAVFVFAFLGFEHSIADSVLFLITGVQGVGDPLMEVLTVTVILLGNFVGGGLLIGLNFAVMNDHPHTSAGVPAAYHRSALHGIDAHQPTSGKA